MTTSTSFTAESAALPATRATDLDDGFMDGGPAPLWPFLQGLGNAKAAFEGALIGHLSWSGDLAMAAGGAANNFALSVGAINAAFIYTGSVYKALSAAAATVTQAKVQGGGGTLGAAAAWWYVYAYDNAGTLDYEVSTTVPNPNRTAKNGDATRLYLGCFRTLSTGAPIPFQASRGRYVYDLGGCAYDDVKVVSAGAATTFTAVDCSTLVPPHARIANLDLRAALPLAGGALNSSVEVQKYGSSGAAVHALYCGDGTALAPSAAHFDVALDSSRRAQYKVVGGANAPTVDVLVAGFYE